MHLHTTELVLSRKLTGSLATAQNKLRFNYWQKRTTFCVMWLHYVPHILCATKLASHYLCIYTNSLCNFVHVGPF